MGLATAAVAVAACGTHEAFHVCGEREYGAGVGGNVTPFPLQLLVLWVHKSNKQANGHSLYEKSR